MENAVKLLSDCPKQLSKILKVDKLQKTRAVLDPPKLSKISRKEQKWNGIFWKFSRMQFDSKSKLYIYLNEDSNIFIFKVVQESISQNAKI